MTFLNHILSVLKNATFWKSGKLKFLFTTSPVRPGDVDLNKWTGLSWLGACSTLMITKKNSFHKMHFKMLFAKCDPFLLVTLWFYSMPDDDLAFQDVSPWYWSCLLTEKLLRHGKRYNHTSYISHTKSQNLNISCLVLQCLCAIYWSQVLSPEWRCSWSSANRRCSNYIWMSNKFIAH